MTCRHARTDIVLRPTMDFQNKISPAEIPASEPVIALGFVKLKRACFADLADDICGKSIHERRIGVAHSGSSPRAERALFLR